MGLNPLIGPNDDRLGPRFPDMIEPYDRGLQDLALEVALEANIVAHRGVYVAVVGPNLETRAEYRFLRGIGADVVGMSTVPEVLVAVHAGLKVLGLLDRHRHVPARRLAAGQDRGDHRRGQRGRGQAADDRPRRAGAVDALNPGPIPCSQVSDLTSRSHPPTCSGWKPDLIDPEFFLRCRPTTKPYKETLNLPVDPVRHEGEPDGPRAADPGPLARAGPLRPDPPRPGPAGRARSCTTARRTPTARSTWAPCSTRCSRTSSSGR